MLWWTHDHHRDVRALASAPCTTALHSTIPEKFAVTRHGLPQFPPAAPLLRPTPEFAPSVVSDLATPPLASDLHRHANRCSGNSDRSHHVQRRSLPVVTSPRSAENRNTHRPLSAARGFVPRRLSYASRRPKLFTKADGPLWTIGVLERSVLSRAAPDRRGWQHGVILRRIAAGWDDGD